MNTVRETSLEAYYYIRDNGLLSKVRFKVYEYLFHHGPAAAKEVDMALNNGRDYTAGTYVSRLSELRDAGVVKEVGFKTCKHTGRRLIVWDVTSLRDPIKPQKKTSKTQQLEAEIERLQDILRAHGIDFEQSELPLEEDPF
jgi:hypothetical protein